MGISKTRKSINETKSKVERSRTARDMSTLIAAGISAGSGSFGSAVSTAEKLGTKEYDKQLGQLDKYEEILNRQEEAANQRAFQVDMFKATNYNADVKALEAQGYSKSEAAVQLSGNENAKQSYLSEMYATANGKKEEKKVIALADRMGIKLNKPTSSTMEKMRNASESWMRFGLGNAKKLNQLTYLASMGSNAQAKAAAVKYGKGQEILDKRRKTKRVEKKATANAQPLTKDQRRSVVEKSVPKYVRP